VCGHVASHPLPLLVILPQTDAMKTSCVLWKAMHAIPILHCAHWAKQHIVAVCRPRAVLVCCFVCIALLLMLCHLCIRKPVSGCLSHTTQCMSNVICYTSSYICLSSSDWEATSVSCSDTWLQVVCLFVLIHRCKFSFLATRSASVL
jgi:hypothetical protein